jgi:hypothetical protein
VSLVSWCLHNILLSWCSAEDIDVFGRLVPTNIYKNIFLWFSPTRVSKLNSMYYDLSLHVFFVLTLMND